MECTYTKQELFAARDDKSFVFKTDDGAFCVFCKNNVVKHKKEPEKPTTGIILFCLRFL